MAGWWDDGEGRQLGKGEGDGGGAHSRYFCSSRHQRAPPVLCSPTPTPTTSTPAQTDAVCAYGLTVGCAVLVPAHSRRCRFPLAAARSKKPAVAAFSLSPPLSLALVAGIARASAAGAARTRHENREG